MKDFDLVFIGHFAADTIIRNNIESRSLGGGVTYGSLAVNNYNIEQKIGICSNIGKNFDRHFLKIFNKSSIDLSGVKSNSKQTTSYDIRYHNEGRDLILKSRAKSIIMADIPKEFLSAKCFMIVPIANEISLEFVETLLNETDSRIAIDIQGFIRNFNSDGSISMKFNNKVIKSIKKLITISSDRLIIKASEEEANYLGGETDIIKSTINLSDLGEALIISTLGKDGSIIKKRGEKMIHIPAFKPKGDIADETGAGDCYVSVFSSELINSNVSWEIIKRAGYCASAAASFLLEKKGPYGVKSSAEINQRLAMKNTFFSPIHKIIKENYF